MDKTNEYTFRKIEELIKEVDDQRDQDDLYEILKSASIVQIRKDQIHLMRDMPDYKSKELIREYEKLEEFYVRIIHILFTSLTAQGMVFKDPMDQLEIIHEVAMDQMKRMKERRNGRS